MIVASWKEDDLLALRRVNDPADVSGDLGAAGEDAQVDRLEPGEEGILALDRHHGFPWRHLVAVIEGVYAELGEILGAELEDGDRLIHAADHGLLLLKELHQRVGVALVSAQHVDRAIEIAVTVIAFADPLHRQSKDRRIQPLAAPDRRVGWGFGCPLSDSDVKR